jgi:hypothetical protein
VGDIPLIQGQTQLLPCPRSLARSLESKWGVIKHNATKFCSNYQAMAALNERGESSENTFQVLELFKAKHPKQGSFVFIHC